MKPGHGDAFASPPCGHTAADAVGRPRVPTHTTGQDRWENQGFPIA